jgi:alkylation response protein AidB-like acyl-CoA dehydrogenase
MDLRPDPLQTQLRRALRAGLAGVTLAPGVSGPPVPQDLRAEAAAVLAELGAAMYEVPASRGGLGLGLTAGVLVSEELGRAACGNPYRAAALVADAALAAGRADVAATAMPGGTVALAGLAALPLGSAVTATPAAGGWQLSGTVALDGLGADLVAVACQAGGEPALALLPAGSPGGEISGEWPGTLRLAGVTATADQVLRLFAGPLARARIRQAGYLLGLAAGMLAAAVSYAGGRRQFGTRLRDLPPVAFPLAQQTVALRGARLLCYRAAWLADGGEPDPAAAAAQADPAAAAAQADPAAAAAQASPAAAAAQASTAAAEALAAAAETLAGVARVSMQVCGVRAMTPELGLHRYYRLAPVEACGHGHPADLWRLAGAARLTRSTRAA